MRNRYRRFPLVIAVSLLWAVGGLTERTSASFIEFGPTGGKAFILRAGPDGVLWLTEGKSTGRITTDSVITEFQIPAAGALLPTAPSAKEFSLASARPLKRSDPMTTTVNLDALADASPFIFVGSIRGGASTSALVTVEDALRTPAGLSNMKGREVTVLLSGPLPAGRYVFFADHAAVGATITVRERGHIDATQPSAIEQVIAAQSRAFASRIAKRTQAATVVALGTVGEVQPLGDQGGGQITREVAWATAPFTLERVLKGDDNMRSAVLVGPRIATSRLPLVPALRSGLRAILFLQQPPREAIDALPAAKRGAALFIEQSSDIQSPDKLPEIERMVREEQTR